MRNDGKVPAHVHSFVYESRDPTVPGGWREISPPAMSGSIDAAFWASPVGNELISDLDLSPGVDVPLDPPRPSLPSGSVWRIRFQISPELRGIARLKSMAEFARLRAVTGNKSLPWVNFRTRHFGMPTPLFSPEMAVP